MRFRPSPIPTVAVGIALVILVNLGLWQLRRNTQTQARLSEVAAAHEGPGVTADGLTGDPARLKWRKSELTGRLVGAPAYLTGRFEFGEPGFDLIQVAAIDGGPRVLVNRGWVPLRRWQEATAEVAPSDASVPLRGLVLPIDGPPDLAPIPADEGAPERWAVGDRADLTGCSQVDRSPYAAIAQARGGVDYPVVLILGESLAEGQAKAPRPLPVTGYHARPESRPHLEYAGTWFSIGGALLALWIWAGLRRGATAA